MALNTAHSPHIHANTSITAIMLNVVLALVPAIITYLWFFGWGLLIHITIALTTALLCEALILFLRKKPIKSALMDGSALVTALLIAFCIPPLAPWWITFIGTAFAIIIAKHLYGGLGYNPFNPAMVGYAMLLISFPREMTNWMSPDAVQQLGYDVLETLRTILFETSQLDAISMATPLDSAKTALTQALSQTTSPQNPLNTILENKSLILFDAAYEAFIRDKNIPRSIFEIENAEILMKYEGYIKREKEVADKLMRLEDIKIYKDIDYSKLSSLSAEAVDKLTKVKPSTIGQASRISGISQIGRASCRERV